MWPQRCNAPTGDNEHHSAYIVYCRWQELLQLLPMMQRHIPGDVLVLAGARIPGPQPRAHADVVWSEAAVADRQHRLPMESRDQATRPSLPRAGAWRPLTSSHIVLRVWTQRCNAPTGEKENHSAYVVCCRWKALLQLFPMMQHHILGDVVVLASWRIPGPQPRAQKDAV